MANVSQYKNLLSTGNIKAFILAIRNFEGTAGPDGYKTMFTGKLFTDFSDHPNQRNVAGKYASTAAGAYQFVYGTWLSLKRRLGLTDFTPLSQDLAMMLDLDDHNALQDIQDGKMKSALRKVRREWASTPYSPDNQHPATYTEWVNYYKAKGGKLLEEDEPSNQTATTNSNSNSTEPKPQKSSKLAKLAPFISTSSDTMVVNDPTIEMEEIKILNKGQLDGTEATPYKAGSTSPLIKINDHLYQDAEIENMRLIYADVIPTLTLRIIDRSGMFTSRKSMPKDGDIINLYIKSENPDVKPIRQDFRIITCTKLHDHGDSNGDIGTYSLYAVLHIDFNNTDDEYYADSTSAEALMEIAKEMKLGYATNDTKQDDSQTWIKPLKDRLWFIDYILKMSFKDDESFYFGYVDQWYYFNFIEVNQKAKAKELDKASVMYLAGDYTYAENEDDAKTRLVESHLLLSNSPRLASTPMAIKSFEPFNHTGTFWSDYGYQQELMYYRKDEQEGTQYSMDTLIGEPEEGEITLRGRKDEDHTTIKKYKNLGIQVNSNVHKNYFHAGVQNEYNLSNLKKMGMTVKTNMPNLYIHRYDTIPVFIFNTNNTTKMVAESQPDTNDDESDKTKLEPANTRLDEVLSGFYLVLDIQYNYDHTGAYGTTYTLVKREWNLE